MHLEISIVLGGRVWMRGSYQVLPFAIPSSPFDLSTCTRPNHAGTHHGIPTNGHTIIKTLLNCMNSFRILSSSDLSWRSSSKSLGTMSGRWAPIAKAAYLCTSVTIVTKNTGGCYEECGCYWLNWGITGIEPFSQLSEKGRVIRRGGTGIVGADVDLIKVSHFKKVNKKESIFKVERVTHLIKTFDA